MISTAALRTTLVIVAATLMSNCKTSSSDAVNSGAQLPIPQALPTETITLEETPIADVESSENEPAQTAENAETSETTEAETLSTNPAPVSPTPVATSTPSPTMSTNSTSNNVNSTKSSNNSRLVFDNSEPTNNLLDKTVQGRLSAADVNAVVSTHLNDIRSCYEKGLKEFAALEGLVKTEFVINSEGKVLRSRVLSSTIASPIVDSCVTSAIAKWVFPRTILPTNSDKSTTVTSSTTVVYPFMLQWTSNFAELQKQMAGCWEAKIPEMSMGDLNTLSLEFTAKQTKPRALLLAQKNSAANNKKPATPNTTPISIGFSATVYAANLRDDRLALVMSSEAFPGKIALAGTYKNPAQQFVAVAQLNNKRTPLTFYRQTCSQSLVRMASWAFPNKNSDLPSNANVGSKKNKVAISTSSSNSNSNSNASKMKAVRNKSAQRETQKSICLTAKKEKGQRKTSKDRQSKKNPSCPATRRVAGR